MSNDIFESSSRPQGDIAGIFEYDGETAYFYLYDMTNADKQKIVAALRISAGEAGFLQSDIHIRWSKSSDIVGLFIFDRLWAAFDIFGGKYGGNYQSSGQPMIPSQIARAFASNGGQD